MIHSVTTHTRACQSQGGLFFLSSLARRSLFNGAAVAQCRDESYTPRLSIDTGARLNRSRDDRSALCRGVIGLCVRDKTAVQALDGLDPPLIA